MDGLVTERLNALIDSQFVRFAVVGTIGFLVDVTVLYIALHGLGLGFYAGRVLSFLAAATTTWLLNRRYTFQGAEQSKPSRQWATFVTFMTLGAVVNYGTYVAIVWFGPDHLLTPFSGVAAGSIAALAVNYTTSRRFVFKSSSGVE